MESGVALDGACLAVHGCLSLQIFWLVHLFWTGKGLQVAVLHTRRAGRPMAVKGVAGNGC